MTEPQPIKKILFPTDFSEIADEAFAQAVAVADHYSAELVMVHVVPERRMGPGDWPDMPGAEQLLEVLEQEAHQRVTALGEVPRIPIRQIMRRAEPAPGIVAIAEEEGVDLIVMATHGHRGLRKWMLGSVTEEVARSAPCDLLILRRREQGVAFDEVRRILVPTDFSANSRAAIERATDLAVSISTELRLMHVFTPPAIPSLSPDAALQMEPQNATLQELAETELEAAAERVRDRSTSVSTHSGVGSAAGEIVEHAKAFEADLIVLCSHGRSGLQQALLGSVTERVLQRSPCPVWVVRASSSAEPG